MPPVDSMKLICTSSTSCMRLQDILYPGKAIALFDLLVHQIVDSFAQTAGISAFQPNHSV